jgi:hypothetical protein
MFRDPRGHRWWTVHPRWTTVRVGQRRWTRTGLKVAGLMANLAQKWPRGFGWAWASPCRGMEQELGEGRWAASRWGTGVRGAGRDCSVRVV